jgi:RNA polymerase sigma factor (TIGR02999 family)
MTEPPTHVTVLLEAHRDGNRAAFQKLVEIVYAELRGIAHIQRVRSSGHGDLQTTALVSELYLKLVGHESGWRDRGHFFAACATAIRNILIDDARRRMRKKRGGADVDLAFVDAQFAGSEDPAWLVRLDELMRALAQHDPRLVQVFECRYFAGYTSQETAEALSLNQRTVQRDWVRARAWLQGELRREEREEEA